DDFQIAVLLERVEVIGSIGRSGSWIDIDTVRKLPLTPLNIVSGIGESGHELPIDKARGTANVIEMQVRYHHRIDVFVAQTQFFKDLAMIDERFDLIALFISLAPAVTHAGFDQYALLAGLNQNQIAREQNSVQLVSRRAFAPQGFGHDPEHRPAIELVCALP